MECNSFSLLEETDKVTEGASCARTGGIKTYVQRTRVRLHARHAKSCEEQIGTGGTKLGMQGEGWEARLAQKLS